MKTRLETSDTMLLDSTSRHSRPEECGGKGWNLLRLRQLGFPVPEFVILPSTVFEACSAAERSRIDAVLSALEDGGSGTHVQACISEASHLLHGIVLALQLPGDVRKALRRGFAAVAQESGLVSVRSSVAGEDGTEHSFAGQMDSILNVDADALEHAVKAVWASAYSERAIAYRLRTGLPLRGIRIAVVLQRMLDAEAAGVLFTRDPMTGAQVCIVTAGFGLGEGVVSDSVECDTYRCLAGGRRVERTIAEKTRRMQRPEDGGIGARLMPVPRAQRSLAVLDDTEVLLLRDWAARLESAMRTPVDMEWARTRDGVMHVLQVRPITTAPPPQGELFVWDNANIVESYPGLTLPLTFSFIRQAYERAFLGAMRGFHLRSTPVREMAPQLSSLLGLLRGRVYYNLRNWYGILSLLPGFRRHKQAWDQMIGITESIDIPQAKLSWLDRTVAVLLSAWRLLDIRGNARRFFRDFDLLYREASAFDIASADAAALRRFYDDLAERAPRFWPRTLYNDFAAMTWYDALRRLCGRWGCRDGLHNALLCAEPGIESVQPVRALVRMAERIRRDPALASAFTLRGDLQLLELLRTKQIFAPLYLFLEDYLARYGDRGFEELKLESRSYRDEPEVLLGLLRGYVESDLTVQRMEEDELRTRSDAEREMAGVVRNPLRRWVLRFVLGRARAAVAARENMRFARSRFYGLIRRLFRRLGIIFSEQGLLDSPDDIHYLQVEEIFAITESGFGAIDPDGENTPRVTVVRRKCEYEEAAAHRPPSRFVTVGIPSWSQVPDAGESSDGARQLRGTGCSAGLVTAPAALVRDPRSAADVRGRILVARSTDPGWVFLMISAAGLIVERGSVLSHTAIIGRELGIPTIVAVADAMRHIPDGASVTMNGSTGEITWL